MLISSDESFEENFNSFIRRNRWTYNESRSPKQNIKIASLEFIALPEERKEANGTYEIWGLEQRITDYLKNYSPYEQIQVDFDEIKMLHTEEYIKSKDNTQTDIAVEEKFIQYSSDSSLEIRRINEKEALNKLTHCHQSLKTQIIQLKEKIIFKADRLYNLKSNQPYQIETVNQQLIALQDEFRSLLNYSKNIVYNNLDDFQNLITEENDFGNKISFQDPQIYQSQLIIENLRKKLNFFESSMNSAQLRIKKTKSLHKIRQNSKTNQRKYLSQDSSNRFIEQEN